MLCQRQYTRCRLTSDDFFREIGSRQYPRDIGGRHFCDDLSHAHAAAFF